ncbi:uncharacterized protein LOC141707587 [Apium graveolens]|uniref:uncharacterized protein LOC141707587 n=1 Tax=Apium graveolens TaxID=4045 RepID=UPI003D79FAAD
MVDPSSSSSNPFRNLEKRPLDEGDEESAINLDNLEISNLNSCKSFNFMNEAELFSGVEVASKVSPPLSHRTLEFRERVLRESLEIGRLEFPRGSSLDYISHFSNHRLNMAKLESWVDLKNGYKLRVPTPDERMWVMPEFGIHGIPLIMFEYGLRLPMHPFHLAMYEAIGCEVAQLSPNSVAQITSFIALCSEKDRIPSVKLFFSIYCIRYHNGKVYFDTQSKRPKIVSVKSSNSGYHPKWVYIGGKDLEFVMPCRKVTQSTVEYLNGPDKYDAEYLDGFQGSRPVFTHNDLKDFKFLEEHNLAGSSLKKLLDSGVLVEMEKAMMMLVKKSKVGAVDTPRVEENTSSKTISIELLDEAGNKVIGGSERVTCEEAGNPSRKRSRNAAIEAPEVAGKKFCEDVGGSGVNRTITFIGNRGFMQPTVDPEASKEIIRVEIRPTERLVGGSTAPAPLRAFRVFNLPQDSSAYAKRSRSELVDRCLGRAGRYLSDVMHLLEEYRADEGKSSPSRIEEERDILRDEKKRLENDLVEARGRITEISKANSSFRSKISELELANDNLKKESEGGGSRLKSVEVSLSQETKKREALEAEVTTLREKSETLETDNLNLKLEVEKGIKDIAGALDDGYGHCLTRMKKVGFDVNGHGFEDYLQDYAQEHKEADLDS